MALYSGKAFCRRRQCCRSAGTCHSKACSMSELSGAVHDGSCSIFAAASVTCIQIRGLKPVFQGETDLQSGSISGLSVEIHNTGTASRDCCNANDKSSYVKLRQAMDYKTCGICTSPFAVRVRMWGGLFLIGERCKVQVKAGLRGGKVDLQFCISRELSNYPNVSVENFIYGTLELF